MRHPAYMDTSFINGICVVVHNEKPPSSEEWEHYLAVRTETVPKTVGSLVYTVGGRPSPEQQHRMEAIWREHENRAPIAVLVPELMLAQLDSSRLAQFSNPIRAFAANKVQEALDYLHVDEAAGQAVRLELHRMCESLSIPQPR